MGKVIRQNIMRIFNALGAYAFPNGKPILNWGSTVNNHSVSVNGVTGGLTITDVKVDGSSVGSLPAQVVEGKSLSLRLALPSNLYVFDDNVSVKMGGVDITSTAFDEATGEINIVAVTDDVIITAAALTYVQNGLAFQLDCKNRGGQAGHWIDLIGNIDFTLGSAVVAADSGVVFDGSANSYGLADASLVVAPANATVEAVVLGASGELNPILLSPANGTTPNTGLAIFTSSGNKMTCLYTGNSGTGESSVNCAALVGNVNDFAMSLNKDRYVNKGVSSTTTKHLWILGAGQNKLSLARHMRTDPANDIFTNCTIKAIRVYNAVLTQDQQLQNWIVDKKRFNIS